MKNNQSITSGDAARYCGVTLRTVIRWIEKGHLKAYKLPGRGNNRILLGDFLAFLQAHDMPVPAELQPLSPAGNKVLVVDDDDGMTKAIARVLRRRGFEVTTANDGFQAGVKLAEFTPDLMILDLMMPKMNGFEVLAYLRESDFSNIHVLVISASGDELLNKALAAGADDILAKPFDNAELAERVSQLTGYGIKREVGRGSLER